MFGTMYPFLTIVFAIKTKKKGFIKYTLNFSNGHFQKYITIKYQWTILDYGQIKTSKTLSFPNLTKSL